ncbi:adenylate/guanylate cyclase domain-containing protein [Tropicibacter sp. R16_0]|uniref:adenylate/guanylate cyclase domain-containing protein n=1 Tax=Tropicibacter sp. R16_0 TaxID=2821102 RepID=UPI001ADC10B1|nr:adenylate/guanylate cyclase domain-containing protein [Tropicibacter sp. R16_0]MBO9450573.1 adenylate/guanylate cyclase domain-containing protein [Tropicibacter sp. R16_0]
MTETAAPSPRRERFFFTQPDVPEEVNEYTQAVLENHKREGLELAVRARWIAMAIIAVFLVFINPAWEVVYYHFILALVALNGWFIRRAGRVGQSSLELFLLFMDLLIMTLGMLIPNPFSDDVRPLAMQYEFGYFQYFFLILAGGTLAYSWRTVIAIGTWTAGMWTVGWIALWWFATPIPGLTDQVKQAFAGYPDVAEFMNPDSVMPSLRIQEAVVFMIVAVTLAFSVRRFNRLLLSNASLERERANLSRYFSPNVVDQLSQNDEPLKQVRNENIAVLFIDIVGFTKFAADRDPYSVIELLRGFHSRMEAEVFRHNGTLDKYLGDGLMATFGTPISGERDASNAMACARSMVQVLEQWNAERKRAGEPEIQAGIGVHYGPALLGDIGANRLEYAVIGNAVNVAAKLEGLTRDFGVKLVVSSDLRDQVIREHIAGLECLEGLELHSDQGVRGVDGRMDVWTL